MNPYFNCRVYGPYIRNDGRKHIIAIFPNGMKRTVSYPKYLVEKSIGRFLTNKETVHHKDGKFYNNKIDNLKIIIRKIHSSIHAIKIYPEQREYKCLLCNKKFILKRKQIITLAANKKRNKKGPFCSRVCSGKYGKFLQLSASKET